MRAALEEICDWDEAPAGIDHGGVRFDGLVTPRDGETLARVMTTLNALRSTAAVRGQGSQSWLGNPLREARALVSTAGLAGVDELDEADGVVRVRAGTPVAELREKVEACGWSLPVDPVCETSTVGGALATALEGPRRLGFGPVRDVVLGLDTVLASGERTRCGARVVKNVTGYDLAKLYVGSLGTLGVIEAAWLRLQPASERAVVMACSPAESSDPFAAALTCARRATARAVSLIDEPLTSVVSGFGASAGGPGPYRLVAEFAGDAIAVERDAAWLADHAGGVETGPGSLAARRALGVYGDPIGVRARLHALPAKLPRCMEAIRQAGGRVVVDPVPGTLRAYFGASLDDGEDPWWLDRVLGVIDATRREVAGDAVIEVLPEWGRGRRDVFGGSEALSLMRALKLRFDPNGVLNPGRFVGSI